MFDLVSTSNTATSTLLLPLMFDLLLLLTKSNISGKSKVAVAVLLVLTKSNISGNSKVAVAVLLITSVAAATQYYCNIHLTVTTYVLFGKYQ
jgi:hypothetical protein